VALWLHMAEGKFWSRKAAPSSAGRNTLLHLNVYIVYRGLILVANWLGNWLIITCTLKLDFYISTRLPCPTYKFPSLHLSRYTFIHATLMPLKQHMYTDTELYTLTKAWVTNARSGRNLLGYPIIMSGPQNCFSFHFGYFSMIFFQLILSFHRLRPRHRRLNPLTRMTVREE